MNGIRCVLVDVNGLVVNYFMASPENGAINAGKDGCGLSCLPHAQAMTGDTIINGVWVQSPQNAVTPDAPADKP